MIRIALCALSLSLSVVTAATKPSTQPIGPNRAANGGFESEGGWGFSAVNGCQGAGSITTEQAHTGSHAYKLTNATAFGPNVYARAFQVVGGLEPFTTYRISCFVKGEDVGIAWIGGGPGWFHRKPFPKGSYDWTYLESIWTTDAGAGDYELMIATEDPTKAVYIDDVKFEPIAVDAAKRDEVIANHRALVAAQQKHFADVQSKIAGVPGASLDPTIHMGIAVARRFLDRVTTYPAVQSNPASVAQLEEIDVVLNETEKELEQFQKLGKKPQPLDYPLGGKVTIRDGVFYTDTSAGKDQPWFFYGMGHFSQVMRDLPFFHEMGATIVQDGRCGPSAMNKDGTLRDGARTLLADMDRAAMYGTKTDFLLSPHYFPDWAWAEPGTDELKAMQQGGLGFLNVNIDHPRTKDAIGRWTDIMSKQLQTRSALFSICLSNEPVNDGGGKNAQSLPLYRAYLREIHHDDIAALNKIYGTPFKSFDEVTAPAWGYTPETTKNCAFYDWQRFNKKHFADWHAWMRDILKKNLPDIPVHAKPMIFFSMDRDKASYGVDAEDFTAFSDIAGCDAYAFPAGDYQTYDWRGHEFWYDLLNSFHNQPVFNSENHIIPDGTGLQHIPATMTRAQYWQGALHHQGVTTTWVWEEPNDPALVGSIYFRPANVYGAGRAFIDIGHFAKEVAAINQAPAAMAILYSQPSIFWEEKYAGAIQDLYTQFNFLGMKTTFVSEKMLQEGRIPKVKCIALVGATHVEDATVAALQKYVAGGGKVIVVGESNLAFDQYHRKREQIPGELAGAPSIFTVNASAPDKIGSANSDKQQALFNLLTQQGIPPVELRDTATGKLAWDVEYRVVPYQGKTLVPMINFGKKSVTVKGPSSAGQNAIDLLTGETVSGDEPVTLEPMVPRLFRAQ